MTLLLFLAIAFSTGSVSVLLRRRTRASAAIGVAGFLLALAAASTIRAGEAVELGGVELAGTAYLRLFLVLACAASLLLVLVAVSTTWSPSLPGATLVALGAIGFALGVSDAGTAVAAATGGAVAGLLVALPGSGLERSLLVAARELRALVVVAVLGLVAAAAVAGPLLAPGRSSGPIDPTLLGIAYLAFAGAASIRLGVIPFHLRAARVADAAPGIGLPLVMAWGPAAFAIVALGWVNTTVAPTGETLPLERTVIGVTAVASIVLGTVAALLYDDLEHVVAYSIVADAGVALLAVAALSPETWAPARVWLLAFVVGKAAFAAWAVSVRGTFRTNRLSELSGWARRAPLLTLGLLAVAVAGVGWPGMAAFGARRALAELAAGGLVGSLVVAFGLASVAIYVRLLLVGLTRPGPTVASAPSSRPTWPGAGRRRSRVRLADAPEAWASNRAPVAGLAALVLALVAVAVSGGWLGTREAVAEPPPAGSSASGLGASGADRQ